MFRFLGGPPRGFGPALTLRAQASNPIGSAGQFSLALAGQRLVPDPAFQPDALDPPPVPPAAEIGQPNAVRTFFEGPERRYSFPTSDPPAHEP